MYILNNKTIYSITLAQFLYSASRTLAARSMSRRREEPSLGRENKRSRDSESGFPNETAQPDHPVIKLTINKPQNTPSTSPSTSSPLVVDFGPHLDSKWTRTASASLVALTSAMAPANAEYTCTFCKKNCSCCPVCCAGHAQGYMRTGHWTSAAVEPDVRKESNMYRSLSYFFFPTTPTLLIHSRFCEILAWQCNWFKGRVPDVAKDQNSKCQSFE